MGSVRNRDYASPMLDQTKGIVFFSTPHKGSPIVKWNKTTLEKVLRFAPIVGLSDWLHRRCTS